MAKNEKWQAIVNLKKNDRLNLLLVPINKGYHWPNLALLDFDATIFYASSFHRHWISDRCLHYFYIFLFAIDCTSSPLIFPLTTNKTKEIKEI
ncbi:hypothetical protein FHS68_001698 [Dyadobacter arcticus]|uniref:Uncharacterized protein n=1 Tax=Dyadobacter arcticus TaxID=1078754 RepID=A0ABX0UJ50_9BACT|nr:hypothetical protein [Dyadobacter arcticus]